MQIYLEDDYYQLYSPFISHFVNDPALVEHFKDTRTNLAIQNRTEFSKIPMPLGQDEDDLMEDL